MQAEAKLGSDEPEEGEGGSTASGAQCRHTDAEGVVGAYADSEHRGAGETSTPMSRSVRFLHRHGLGSESEGHTTGEEDLPGPERTPTELSENSDLELELEDKSQEAVSLDASNLGAATDSESSSEDGNNSEDDKTDSALLGGGDSLEIILEAALNDIRHGHIPTDLGPLTTTEKALNVWNDREKLHTASVALLALSKNTHFDVIPHNVTENRR